MISYKLAKQLKEAGFPFIEMVKQEALYQRGKNGDISCVYCGYPIIEIDGKYYLEPNLNVLIDICGDDFSFLETNDIRENRWYEAIGARFKGKNKKASGKFPEEAVAKLWLKLNEK